MCEGVQGAREVSDPLELKLQAVESLFSWVQEVTSGSPGEQDVLLTAELFLQVPPGFISFDVQLQLKVFFLMLLQSILVLLGMASSYHRVSQQTISLSEWQGH